MRAWTLRKGASLARLLGDEESGRVDPDVVWLVHLINLLPDYYTTSSCSGRIQLASTRLPGEKFRMRVVAKWHHPVTRRAVERVLGALDDEHLWLAVHPPILHIMCRDLGSALEMLRAARGSGFKRAGIQGVRGDRVAVEIVGTERIEAPLRLEGRDLLDREGLGLLVDYSNILLLRAKARLLAFERAVMALHARVSGDPEGSPGRPSPS